MNNVQLEATIVLAVFAIILLLLTTILINSEE